MKTAMQLNALIRDISKAKNINAEIILRNYMFERLLERISLSEHKNKFILKGGMLITAIAGIDIRTTMDMDATLKGQDMDEQQIVKLFQDIVDVNVGDNITFTFKKVAEIHEVSEYPGYRITYEARLEKTRQTLNIDVTTGDAVTPREIEYQYKLMFENRAISIMAYNLETVLAEKMEGILIRGVTNTRMRDYYDVFLLTTTQSENINMEVYKSALINTTKKRNTESVLNNTDEILTTIRNSPVLQELWQQYQKNNAYAKDLSWETIINSIYSLAPE